MSKKDDVQEKCKKPSILRNGALKSMLKNSLLNLNAEWINTKNAKKSDFRFNSVDLFSGAGGISCGFDMAGLKSIMGIEIDPVASETYRNNFPDAHQINEDITKLSEKEIKKHLGDKTVHVLTGGFPCQGFSVAGFRDPDDKRNVLYKEVVRMVKEIKPWFVVLENVPGVVTMKGGKVYKTIIEDFERIGYPNMSVHILEAADYGVGQFRPRTIFIANRFGLKNPYPKPHLKPEEYVPIEKVIDDLKNKERDPSINHEWTKHKPDFVERIKKVKPGCSLYPHFVDAYKRQYKGVPSMTIKENHGGTHLHPELHRCISAREMARLQSFPDSFIFAGTMKKAMWQIGNAVPPLMFKNIASAVIEKLEEIEKLNLDEKK
jgi:DNA (cytosine-5)-methyltransferase 1